MKEITVEQLKKKIDHKESFQFLDVREPFEAHLSSINVKTVSIPLDDLEANLDQLEKAEEIVVMCRSGNRSAQACELLEHNGFNNVANLKGGINEWAAKIDPSLPRY